MTTFNPPIKIMDTITTIRADATIAALQAVRAEAHRKDLHIRARVGIAEYLIACEVGAERAYATATRVLEGLPEMIAQGPTP